jgi:acyl-CoA reductase-like NAD-dependent aldehyde dehydrogenase
MTAEPNEPAGTIEITSPLDGHHVGTAPITDPADVEAAVARARAAFESWGSMTHRERRPYLRAYTKHVLKNMDRIGAIVSAETGKHHGDALAEVTAALTAMDMYSRQAAKLLKPKKGKAWPFPSMKGWTEYHPRGVAGVITPWNYPFYLPMLGVIQALAAGCTVVLKPSEVTPHSGEILETLAREVGFPERVIVVVHGYGDTGAALVKANVDIVSFTGSSETGKLIAAEAADTLKPLILELGGKDAMIVLEDANILQAAKAAATFGTFNAGQTCVAVERIYVIEEVYDEFVSHLNKALGELRIGTEDRRDIGPIITADQIKIIERHVEDARDKGATIVRGGKRVDTEHSTYFEPTLILDVDHTMDLMRDETFGPVVPVMSVPDQETALQLANDTRYGLHGSVWSRDKSRARSIASRMKTGTVAINDHLVNFFYPSITLAGTGESGYSGVMGDEGIKAYCVPRSITQARLKPTTRLMGAWMPRRVGPRYWKVLAKALFGWRR